MRRISFLLQLSLTLTCVLLFTGCQKFLDKKPDAALAVPSTLADLQALLDNNSAMNFNNNNGLGEASSDNYYLTYAGWSSFLFQVDRNVYTWEADVSSDRFPNDWARLYKVVYYANTVLETVTSIPRTSQNEAAWDHVKGAALFWRGQSFHSLALLWAKAYDENTAATDPGIPLRLRPDFNETSTRATVQQSYDQMLSDLKSAVPLLPATPRHVLRPSKAAAYALLARVYLSQRKYPQAGQYADSALQLSGKLLNYNNLSPTANFPFALFNDETIFYLVGASGTMPQSKAKVDSALYKSYAANDLRKTLFFKNNGDGSFAFKGSYTNSAELFVGLATDELYLMKAESLARAGEAGRAMTVLNELLKTRWKTGSFTPLTASSPAEALQAVLAERRKELLMRDLRWMDIKRLNKEGANISLRRELNGQVFLLPANDNRFALALPDYVIQLSGMPQNPR